MKNFIHKTDRRGVSILALVSIVGLLALASCSTPKQIAYFQDMTEGGSTSVSKPVEITLRPKDKISIVVNSRDPQLADLFNLPIVSRQVGLASTTSTTGSATGYRSNYGMSGYSIDENGDIDFPVLGKLHIAGMTRLQVADYIKSELVERNLIKDPVVTVEFMNLTVSVMGEVNNPGRYNIDRDNISVLDAISMAGDLTIYGRRENVLVIRKENNEEKSYRLDLCSASDLYQSPVFYLQQGDVVYVEPNDVRARQSTVNGNNVRSTSFWISLASLVTSICVLLFN